MTENDEWEAEIFVVQIEEWLKDCEKIATHLKALKEKIDRLEYHLKDKHDNFR